MARHHLRPTCHPVQVAGSVASLTLRNPQLRQQRRRQRKVTAKPLLHLRMNRRRDPRRDRGGGLRCSPGTVSAVIATSCSPRLRSL
ncbi:unnamed protein product [Amoebophrya sp. A25]|nr:unnamed protein product [Amoebophrya sp. A25]|eukprot:GSA25T00021647001.1